MNRLANEKSPYLLQHKDNPVDWYPWGDEAFERAKKEDKPIFLSIGYATCHWCHVMEHESFEDKEVARRMNEVFINIKVDREERPDIDHAYMTVCQMLTGQGGWPLTIIMTPTKEPFYAATYLPKRSRPNLVGMMEFVPAIQKAWRNDRPNIQKSVQRIKDGFAQTLELGKSGNSLSQEIIPQTRQALFSRFDAANGGFGSSPKFPSPHNLLFLMDHYRNSGHPKDLEMARLTLEKMRLGGLWDHVGFGFHRYSTDHRWLLPHFEKMLYDQATLLLAYAGGWKLTNEPLFGQTAHEIVAYLDDCLTSPEGAFYSAEDADSEGEEGKFYVWEADEIRELLDEMDAALFFDLFQFEDEGNFRDEATHQKTGKNIPHLKAPVPNGKEAAIQQILSKLKAEREKRVRPLLDDKILTDWNGLMIAALARAGIILDEPPLVARAEKAWETIRHFCFDEETKKLFHRLKEEEAAIDGMADDYSFAIWGLLELYQATFKPEYLRDAISLQQTFDEAFFDRKHGGYFFTAEGAEKLLGRQKEIYDGAMPSSNSVAALNGIRLSRLTSNPDYEEKSSSIFRAFSRQIEDAPAGYTFAMLAYEVFTDESMEIVITAKNRSEEANRLIEVCRKYAGPSTAMLLKTASNAEEMDEIAPFLKNYPVQKTPAVYVCRRFECKAPVHTPTALESLLSNGGR